MIGQGSAELRLDVGDLERFHVAVRVLDHEREIDDADRVRSHEIAEGRHDLTLELIPGERHDHVLDWADVHA